MILAEIAMYILILMFVIYMATHVMWLAFFFLNFRVVELGFQLLVPEFLSELSNIERFVLLFLIAAAIYGGLYALTAHLIIIRFILLVAMFIIVIQQYTLAEIFLFRDFFADGDMLSVEFWITQIRELFTTDSEDIMGFFDRVIDNIANFFRSILGAIRGD